MTSRSGLLADMALVPAVQDCNGHATDVACGDRAVHPRVCGVVTAIAQEIPAVGRHRDTGNVVEWTVGTEIQGPISPPVCERLLDNYSGLAASQGLRSPS